MVLRERDRREVTDVSLERMLQIGIPISVLIILTLCFLPGFAKGIAHDRGWYRGSYIERQICCCHVCDHKDIGNR